MSISLVSISNINHALTEFSINQSCDTMKFDEVLVFSDKPLPKLRYDYTYLDIAKTIAPYDVATKKAVPLTLDTYNDFLMKGLANFVNTEHIISIHYDGFCVNQDEWTDEFLEYDYIGSPTHRKWGPLQASLIEHEMYTEVPNMWYTGGGGFSLRSKKLLKALQDPKFNPFLSNKNYQRLEDYKIAVVYKDCLEKEYGIKFAPLELSLKFSTELLTGLNYSFGFHGWENTPLFLSEDKVIWFIQNLNKDNIGMGYLMGRRFYCNCLMQNYTKAIECFLEISGSGKTFNYSR